MSAGGRYEYIHCATAVTIAAQPLSSTSSASKTQDDLLRENNKMKDELLKIETHLACANSLIDTEDCANVWMVTGAPAAVTERIQCLVVLSKNRKHQISLMYEAEQHRYHSDFINEDYERGVEEAQREAYYNAKSLREQDLTIPEGTHVYSVVVDVEASVEELDSEIALEKERCGHDSPNLAAYTLHFLNILELFKAYIFPPPGLLFLRVMVVIISLLKRVRWASTEVLTKDKFRIVVLGGGSGGLSVAQQLYNRFKAAGKPLQAGDTAVVDAAVYHDYQDT
ncbi:hypothetical protein EDB86DRAFT_2829230 [Lactarius hatsudake]|nr:hypothetical protein EDB86DRAFT_2829230 [Lactarius hatsudake]